jgi:hypothetical protein
MTGYHSDGTVQDETMTKYSGAFIEEGAIEFVKNKNYKNYRKEQHRVSSGYDTNPTLFNGGASDTQPQAQVVSPSYTDPQTGGSLPTMPTTLAAQAETTYSPSKSKDHGGLAFTAYHSDGTVQPQTMTQYSSFIQVTDYRQAPMSSDHNPTLFNGEGFQQAQFAEVVSPSYVDPESGGSLPALPFEHTHQTYSVYNSDQSAFPGGLTHTAYYSDGTPKPENMEQYSGAPAAFLELASVTKKSAQFPLLSAGAFASAGTNPNPFDASAAPQTQPFAGVVSPP